MRDFCQSPSAVFSSENVIHIIIRLVVVVAENTHSGGASVMNILPKKSWHVRTRKNIEKVRRDEKEAAARENDRLERIALAEREARTAFLRQQTGSQSGSASAAIGGQQRFDVFSGVDQGKGDVRRNRDREQEDKDRTEEWEQKVGILTYLHKKEKDSSQLWYLQPHEQRVGTKNGRDEERLHETVKRHDPLVLMTKYADQLKTWQAKGKSDHSRRHQNHHRHGHEKQRDDETSGEKTVTDKLREQRLKREQKERKRSEKLLKGNETPQVRNSGARDERNLRFNSQFNPQLARH
jgi:hypothetical protein